MNGNIIKRACSSHFILRKVWFISYFVCEWHHSGQTFLIFRSLLNIMYLQILRMHAFLSRFEESSRLCWFSYLLLNRYCVSNAFYSLAVVSLKITMHLVAEKIWAPVSKLLNISFDPHQATGINDQIIIQVRFNVICVTKREILMINKQKFVAYKINLKTCIIFIMKINLKALITLC